MRKHPRPSPATIAKQEALWARIRAHWEQSNIGLRLLGKRHGITSLTTIRRRRDNPKDPWKRDQAAITVALVGAAAIDNLYSKLVGPGAPRPEDREIVARTEPAEADLRGTLPPPASRTSAGQQSKGRAGTRPTSNPMARTARPGWDRGQAVCAGHPGQLIAASFGTAATTPGAAGRPLREKPNGPKSAITFFPDRMHGQETPIPQVSATDGDSPGPISDVSTGPEPTLDQAGRDAKPESAAQRLALVHANAVAEQVDLADAMIQVGWLLLERLKTIVGAVDELERDAAVSAVIVAKGDSLTSVLRATETMIAGGIAMKRLALGISTYKEPEPVVHHGPSPRVLAAVQKAMKAQPSPELGKPEPVEQDGPPPQVKAILRNMNEQQLRALKKVARTIATGGVLDL